MPLVGNISHLLTGRVASVDQPKPDGVTGDVQTLDEPPPRRPTDEETSEGSEDSVDAERE